MEVKVIMPCDQLKEHAQRLLAINDLRERLRYYNDNICSLSVAYTREASGDPYRSGLRSMGQSEGDSVGVGEVFFRLESASDREVKIYLEERQRELDRLRQAIDAEQTYPGKLNALMMGRVGQLDIEADSFRVFSNDYQMYLAGLNRIVPRGNEYSIDLYPTGYDEKINVEFNEYLYEHVKAVQKNPHEYYWLYKPDYKRFDLEENQEALKINSERAFDRNTPLKSRLKEIEQRYKLNTFVNYRDFLYEKRSQSGYYSPFLGGETWEAAIFNALYNGEGYDLRRRVLTLGNIVDLIYIEDEYSFYVWLRRMLADSLINISNEDAFEGQNNAIEDVQFKVLFEAAYKEHADRFVSILKEGDLYPFPLKALVDDSERWVGPKGAVIVFYECMSSLGVAKNLTKKLYCEVFAKRFKGLIASSIAKKKGGGYRAADYKDYFKSEIARVKREIDNV